MSDTDWIVVGAEVVVNYQNSRRTNSRRAVITKVAAKSFQVEGFDERFRREPAPANTVKHNSWQTIKVVPLDSYIARELLRQEHLEKMALHAWRAVCEWRAVCKWNVSNNTKNIAATEKVIVAMRLLRDVL